MNVKKHFFLIVLVVLLLPGMAFGDSVSFVSNIGNFYGTSIREIGSELKNIGKNTLTFYAPLFQGTGELYSSLGDSALALSERAIYGIESLGGMAIEGASNISSGSASSVAGVGDAWKSVIDTLSEPLVPLFFKTSQNSQINVEKNNVSIEVNSPNDEFVVEETPEPVEPRAPVVVERIITETPPASNNNLFSLISSLRNDIKVLGERITNPTTYSTSEVDSLLAKVYSRISRQTDRSSESLSDSISDIETLTGVTITGSTFSGSITTSSIADANGSTGTAGYVLQSTASGIQWVATSSLGITGGGGGGSGTINSGTANYLAFYDGTGTTLSGLATSSLGIAISDTTGTLAIARGGTGVATAPSYGQILVGNASGGYTLTATSSLGIDATNLTNFGTPFYTFFSATTTDALTQGATNKYYSDSLVQSFIHASTTIPKTYSSNTFTGANIFSGAVTLSSLSDGCLQTSSGLITSTGSACGAGGGSANSKFATSSNGLFLYPNGGTSIGLLIGRTSTTTNSLLEVNGTTTVTNLVATSTTATSTIAGKFSVGSTTPDGRTSLSFGTSTNTALTQNNSTGKWGIGTTTPQGVVGVFNPSGSSLPSSANPNIALDAPSNGSYITFGTGGTQRSAILGNSSGALNFYSSTGAAGFNFYGTLSGGSQLAYLTTTALHSYGYVTAANGVNAGGSAVPPSTLTSSGSTGLKTTLITSNATLSGSYTNVLVDGSSNSVCSLTGTQAACSSYSDQSSCEARDSHGGCTWNAGSSCSVYDNEFGMGSCTGQAGCSAAQTACSASAPADQTTCEVQDDSYGGDCAWTEGTSSCVWDGMSNCSPDGSGSCDTGDFTDQSTCEALTYPNGSFTCTGNFYTGSCSGTYGASCSGTASCSSISADADCTGETGCSIATGVSLTLPSTSSTLERQYWIKNIGTSGTVTILPNTSQTVEGLSSYNLNGRDEAVQLGYYYNSQSCSNYASSQGTCEGYSGCTWADCSGYADQSSCDGQSAYGCSWNGSSCDGGTSCNGTYISVKWYVLSERSGFNPNYATSTADTTNKAGLISKAMSGSFSLLQFQNSSGSTLGSVYGTSTGIGIQRSVANGSLFLNFEGGNVAVGATSTPWRTLSVKGTLALDGLSSFASGDSALCLSANKEVRVNSGVTSCTSSSRLFKHDIESIASSTDKFRALRPVSFTYNDTELKSLGFIAEEVADIDPRLAEWNEGRPKSLSIAGILAYTVHALQVLWDKVEIIAAWFTPDGGKFSVQGEICVDEVCVTKDQFRELLIGGSGAALNSASSTSETATITENAETTENTSVVEENQQATTTSATSTENASTTPILPDTIPEAATTTEATSQNGGASVNAENTGSSTIEPSVDTSAPVEQTNTDAPTGATSGDSATPSESSTQTTESSPAESASSEATADSGSASSSSSDTAGGSPDSSTNSGTADSSASQ